MGRENPFSIVVKSLAFLNKKSDEHHFDNYLIEFRNMKIAKRKAELSDSEFADFSAAFLGVENSIRENKHAFKRLSPVTRRTIILKWVKSCGLKGSDAHRSVSVLSARAKAGGSNDDLSVPLLGLDDASMYRNVVRETEQPQAVKNPAYVCINNYLAGINQKALIKAVIQALENYGKQNTGRFNLHFFRQFFSDGRDDAAEAINTINAAPEHFKQIYAQKIASQILFMGVKEDGQTIEVNHNSRVHYLLKEMKNAGLIELPQINLTDLAYVGREFEVKVLRAV